MISEKHIPFASASGVFHQLRSEGKRLVQCHGTFDLIHPGHITHFEEAKALGDKLVVTITAEDHVNKGPGRPYFNDVMRVKSLTALECVDFVVVVPFAAAVEAIECVRPQVYCKGKEYKNPQNDVTGNIYDDVTTVEKFGGKVQYVGSVVFSSTKLINNHFDALPKDVKNYCKKLSENVTADAFKQAVDNFKNLKVLVVGDIIFDRYSFVHVQGLTSKNRTISARYLDEETHAGGSLAVYRHLKEFTPNVDFFSISGDEPWVREAIDLHVPLENNHTLIDSNFTTVVKQRYVERSKRTQEVSKLFALNYIDGVPPCDGIVEGLYEKLRAIIGNYDLVVVTDFGHGLMQKSLRDLVQDKAKFLALNCQTNSNNHGFNIIARQYRRADAFSLDEQELLLSCAQRHPHYEEELIKLKEQFGSDYAWLTRGANETIGVNCNGEIDHAPVLEQQVTDTVGAGDALFSLVSLAACSQLSVKLATFLGQLAGAQAVNIMGNKEGVRKDRLLKAGLSLLNY